MSSRIRIAIAGVTGSIGSSTIKIIRQHSDRFEIVLASAHSNKEKLIELANEFNINNLVLTGGSKTVGENRNFNLYFGSEELYKLIVDLDYDIFLNAMPGSSGLMTSFHVLKSGHKLALANKESLVLAGHILTEMAKANNHIILPIDSEHSAIFQAIGSHKNSEIRKLHITASGGAFRDLPLNKFKDIKYEDAITHPVWNMGVKVTIDSATMMNKGLECIEARWLFDIDYNRIEPVIHPQSIIHSMVEFRDGSIIAQMSNPSMELPILYAFSYPERIESSNVKTNILNLPDLSFREVDFLRYPLLKLALKVARKGGVLPTVMNAANEAALQLFEERLIRFVDIYKVVDMVVQRVGNVLSPDIETILEYNIRAYKLALEIGKQFRL